VAEVLEMVGLAGYERRAWTELSGGEQQRVALARALAPTPRLLMLDEPLGALDRTLRQRLLDELDGLFEELGLTILYVTHDQEEALALGDRVAVMRAGAGSSASLPPEELWRGGPADRVRGAVRFLGLRTCANIGSGRTTFVRAMAGLIPHRFRGRATGSVAIFGRDAAQTPMRELARDAGLVSADAAARPALARVADEVAFGLENRAWTADDMHARVDQMLESFGLGGRAGDLVETLSAGDRARLALARAVAPRPRLLLLDEPSAYLDQAGRRMLLEWLAQETARQEMAIVIADRHAGALLAQASRVLLLARGREAWFGPPDRVTPAQVAQLHEEGAWLPDEWRRWVAPPPARPEAHAVVAVHGMRHDAERQPESSLDGFVPEPLLVARQMTVERRAAHGRQRRVVLRDAELVLEAGRRVVVTADNGAGTSSLIAALAGWLRPARGHVLIGDGTRPPDLDPRRAPPESLARLLGVIAEQPQLTLVMPTVAREVSIGSRDPTRDEQMWDELSDVLSRFAPHLPPDAAPGRLGAGQQRLLNVAAAAWAASGVLLLDQPAAGLDRRAWELLSTLLDELRALGQAQLIATHDEALAQDADEHLELAGGELRPA
jgi:energy-coupling factor transport system ATP-binding protein